MQSKLKVTFCISFVQLCGLENNTVWLKFSAFIGWKVNKARHPKILEVNVVKRCDKEAFMRCVTMQQR